jgi:hypothetical protein
VVKVDDLAYGTYDVEMKVVYLGSQDMKGTGSYTVWLDAIRVYNPADTTAEGNEIIKDAYEQDGENNPFFTTVKTLLVSPNDFNADSNTVSGFVFVDGKHENVTIAEYDNQGPNNETYLEGGNGVAFKLVAESTTKPVVNFQIGAKLAKGTSATLNVNIGENKDLEKTIATATNMFYKLGTVKWTQTSVGIWESESIVLSCSAASGNILSLTDIKLTGADAGIIENLDFG